MCVHCAFEHDYAMDAAQLTLGGVFYVHACVRLSHLGASSYAHNFHCFHAYA